MSRRAARRRCSRWAGRRQRQPGRSRLRRAAAGHRGARDVEDFIGATLGVVLDYDRRRGTTLAQTLEVYFGVGASPARAAEALHVHVNTVTQRLDRLGTLLGEDWQRPDRALELQLALRLHRLRTP